MKERTYLFDVVCVKCGAKGSTEEKDALWAMAQDGSGLGLCWFCQQPEDEPLRIKLATPSGNDADSSYCLSSST